MEKQLARPENADKGGWEDGDVALLMNETWYHVAKLLKAVEKLEEVKEANAAGARRRNGKYALDVPATFFHAVLEFAADVGNCALIVADVTGALEHSEDDAVGEDGERTIDWQVPSQSGGYP
jgi:hypothetical protein